MSAGVAAALTGMLLIGSAAPVPAVTSYTELETLPGGTTNRAFGINEGGLVVGDSNVSGGASRAALWSETGVVSDLGMLPGDTSSTAYSVNSRGTAIVGRSIGTVERAIRWDGDRKMMVLPGLSNAVRTRAYSVNDSRVTVGFSVTPDGNWHALRWGADATRVELPGLPGDVSTGATWINNRGVSVGGSSTPEGRERAVRWETDGTVEELPALPGHTVSAATSINDRGVMVGGSGENAESPTRAVMWTSDDTVTALDAVPGDTGSYALAISNSGWVVGYSVTPEGRHRAVRWNRDGTVCELGTGAPGTADPYGVAPDGTAVGVVTPIGEPTRAGLWRR